MSLAVLELSRPQLLWEGGAQGELFGRQGHELAGLGHDERFQTEGILGIAEGAGRGGEVGEAAVEVDDRSA